MNIVTILVKQAFKKLQINLLDIKFTLLESTVRIEVTKFIRINLYSDLFVCT